MSMKLDEVMRDLPTRTGRAVAHYWKTRVGQKERQQQTGKADQGLQSAVTGGAQMDGFIGLLKDLTSAAGVPEQCVFSKKAVELPGFFRPTKEWDLLVVRDKKLFAAIEAKSQVGPSFGNNFNNRTEEAMGSALDLWTAYREGAFNGAVRPWLGYLFLLEDCQGSQTPVRIKEPHFEVLPEFKRASYAKRYELFCRKLVRERHYSSAAFLLSDRTEGLKGFFKEPAADLSFESFARSLFAQVGAFGKNRRR